jgi:hypothetical protein
MMLEPEQKSAGVIAASAGNHALALAYHGGQLSKYIIITRASKEVGHEEPYYNTKISVFSFTWAGLAAFHKPSTI